MRAYVYEIETERLVKTLRGFIGTITQVEFSPNGRLLAICDADDRGETRGENDGITLWETKFWNQTATIGAGGQAAIYRMAFSPDGEHIAASGQRPGGISNWRVPSLP